MMEWFMLLSAPMKAFFASLFTWGMTALGASSLFIFRRCSSAWMSFLTALSGGIMISASFFSLLLPALSYETETLISLVVGLGFFLGGGMIPLFDLVLARFFREKQSSLVLLVGSVTLHNIPEGMAIGVALGATGAPLIAGLSLAFGIGIQNIPEGLCLAFPLRTTGKSPLASFTIAQLSGSVEILAAVLGAIFVTFCGQILPWVLSFSAGAMIAVVCSELIPSAFEEKKVLPTFGVILGFSIMMILDLILS